MSSKQLKSFLEQQSPGLCVLQRFVKPKGSKATVARVIWSSTKPTYAYIISNKKATTDVTEKEAAKRLLTNTEQPQMLNFFKMQGKSVIILNEYISEIVKYLQNAYKIKFKEFIADFVNGNQATIDREETTTPPQPPQPPSTSDAAEGDGTGETQTTAAPVKQKQEPSFVDRLSKPVSRTNTLEEETWWFIQVKGMVIDDSKKATVQQTHIPEGEEYGARPSSAVRLMIYNINIFRREEAKQITLN